MQPTLYLQIKVRLSVRKGIHISSLRPTRAAQVVLLKNQLPGQVVRFSSKNANHCLLHNGLGTALS